MIRSAYVAVMRAIAAPLRALGILAWLQRAPHHTFRFWLGSQFVVWDAEGLARLDVPWWSFPAIDAVERWIARRNGDVTAFEYGSGASTVWLARRCRRVVTVEHDRKFLQAVGPMLARDNIELRVIDPVRNVATPGTPSGRAGYEHADFTAYVDSIADDGGYDLVVIDGRARVACLERARQYVKPDGLIVFDNSDRRRYQAAIHAVEAQTTRYRGWAPALPYPSETSLIALSRA
jgi:predicted O-methyltransferase YrrM